MSGRTAPASGKWAALADSGFYLAAATVGRGAHLLSVPVLVRLLPAPQFALFDTALVLITLLATALLLGTDSGAAARYARTRLEDTAALRGIFVASLQVPLGLGLCAASLMGVLHVVGVLGRLGPTIPWLIVLIAVAIAIGSCVVGLLRWTTRARSGAFLIGFNGIVPMLVALGIALEGPASNQQLLAGFLGGQIVAMSVSLAFAWRVVGGFGGASSRVRPQALIASSWTLGVASLAAPGRRAVERLLVLGLLGESALAAYAVLARLAQVLEIALQSLGNGYYPRALRTLDEASGQRLAVLALYLFFGATLFAMVVASFAARPVLMLMGGEMVQLPPNLLLMMLAVGALSALPFCAGMAYFHAEKLAHYAGMVLLASLLSLAFGVAAALMVASLQAWVIGLLAGHIVAAMVFLRTSERMHACGYTWGRVLAGLAAIAGLCAVPILVAMV